MRNQFPIAAIDIETAKYYKKEKPNQGGLLDNVVFGGLLGDRFDPSVRL